MSEIAALPRVRVAAVLIQDESILLVRHAKAGKHYWLLPGGGVDFGESLAEALERELREEVGIKVETGELLLVNDSIPPDKHRHILNLYFRVRLLEGEVRLGEDPRIDQVAFMPLTALDELDFYPAVSRELLTILQEKAQSSPRYIGNRWAD